MSILPETLDAGLRPGSDAVEKPPPRDSARTRARILAAAQRVFSTKGYARAGIREIAAEAHINVALVVRYFGQKEKLFEAAIVSALGEDIFLGLPRRGFGAHIVRQLLDERPTQPNPFAILMQASTDPAAQSTALALLRARIADPLAEWLGEPDGTSRAAAILALTAGVFTYRTMLPLEPFCGVPDPALRRWLEQALQEIVDR